MTDDSTARTTHAIAARLKDCASAIELFKIATSAACRPPDSPYSKRRGVALLCRQSWRRSQPAFELSRNDLALRMRLKLVPALLHSGPLRAVLKPY